MFLTKCDLCQEEISYPNEVNLSYHGPNSKNLAFCLECAEPIVKFLVKHELIASNSDD